MSIYNESHQNFGAPIITNVLQIEVEKISEKTVGNNMRELGIKGQYVKPYTITTIDSEFSIEHKSISKTEIRYNNLSLRS